MLLSHAAHDSYCAMTLIIMLWQLLAHGTQTDGALLQGEALRCFHRQLHLRFGLTFTQALYITEQVITMDLLTKRHRH